MKKGGLLGILLWLFLNTNAGNLDLWGVDITVTHQEINYCKVSPLEDNKIFSQLKICSDGYTFVNDKNIPACFYGDETECFFKSNRNYFL